PIHTADGTIIALLAAHPNDEHWEVDVMAEAMRAMEQAREKYDFMDREASHRRGNYPAVWSGISHGNGRQVSTPPSPMSLPSPSPLHIFDRIHCSGTFGTFVPRLHAYYSDILKVLAAWDPTLRLNFTNSVFAACTFNLGPDVTTLRHLDLKNLAWGWCAVTVLGTFDPRLGGHLVLWDMRLVIEFPLPSAVFAHSNTTIQAGKKRLSFTQYTAFGLFRWKEYGCMTTAQYTKKMGVLCVEQMNTSQWQAGMSMYSKLNEFI
ncbi:hypothetical protein JAAARDRAFT_137698, partial [Jaapia argillacea MUCL 33604]